MSNLELLQAWCVTTPRAIFPHRKLGRLADGFEASFFVLGGDRGEIIRWLVRDTWLSGYPGNVLHVLQSGRPSAVFVFDTPSKSKSGVWTYSSYATDSWRANNRLTINLGVRFDRYRLFLPAQEHAAGSPTRSDSRRFPI